MRGRVVRVLSWGVAALAAVVLLVWVGWSWVLPGFRPGLQDGERYGLDVSVHQGEVDWSAVAADDVAAVYVKASEGETFVDDRFAENWREARDAGLEVGAYHFFTLCRTGEAQAANFLARLDEVGADGSMLPPVLDLELSGNCSARPPAADVQAQVSAYVTAVEAATGQRVTVYLLDGFAERYPPPDDLVDRPRWVRSLLVRPDGRWAWWQVSSRASVDGVEGPVDLNVVAPG